MLNCASRQTTAPLPCYPTRWMRDASPPASCSTQASATASTSSAIARPTPMHQGETASSGIRHTLQAAGVDLAGALDCAWEPEAAYDAVAAALKRAFGHPR